ncbi:MAG: pyridoxal phosphate-dependent aminotransferase [Armatimonadetes bacterium]|nr:pyridoxal phosphate-dependent aminotransferase [Armatimonadota bacterium]
MSLPFAARASVLRPSPTLAIASKARQLQAEGKDVVSFGAGEPDVDSPSAVVEAAVQALRGGKTRYTATSGVPELKDAIVAKLSRDNGISAAAAQIVVSCGAKQSLFNAFQVLVDPGDEVVVFAPYWMTYLDQIALAGGRAVIVETSQEAGFVPTEDAVAAALTPKTKAIVVNSPCNPSGAVFPPAIIEFLARTAVDRGLWLISDEIYERLVYGARPLSPASLGPDVFDRTVTVNGCSKTYAMTGWRIGYACAPAPVAAVMTCLQDQTTSNPTSFAQYGAVAALNLPPDEIEAMRREFESRRDLIVRSLRDIPGVRIDPPEGAFYVLPDFSVFLGGEVRDDTELASLLLDRASVATVPGSVFGRPGCLRLSYACSEREIVEGTRRIKDALSRVST